MNKNKEDVLGKVKYEVLEKLFEMGDLTHPDKLMKTITLIMEDFNRKQYKSYLNRSFNIFTFFKGSLKEFPTYSNEGDFIQAIRSRKIVNVSEEMDDNSIVSLWHKIQDIRVILNLKCVTKRSQSNNVMAGSVTLLTAERVLANQQEYLNL